MPRRESSPATAEDVQDILDREDAAFRLRRIVAAIEAEAQAEEDYKEAVHQVRRARRILREAMMNRRTLASSERRKHAR